MKFLHSHSVAYSWDYSSPWEIYGDEDLMNQSPLGGC